MKFSDFGFKENPFSITPDPRYLFLSRGHEESLAHLIYGTGPNGGFVQLTGEVGTGKTMLVRSLMEQHLEHVDIALILNPRLSRRDFMAAICDELGVSYEGPPYRLKQLTDDLSEHLLKTHSAGRHTVVVVDEAQNLSPRVLEQVRLLTNLETSRHKLLRIILVGQPELQQLLARKDLRQVDQRITARYHLSPLCRKETARYIRYRLSVAGVDNDLFTPSALKLVHYLTGGVPRMINTLCERTLLAIFTMGSKKVTMTMVWRAAREIKGRYNWKGLDQWVFGGVLLVTSATAVWLAMMLVEQRAVEPEVLAGLVEDDLELIELGERSDLALAPDNSNSIRMLDEVNLPTAQEQQGAMPVMHSSPLVTVAELQDKQGEQTKQALQQKLFNFWNHSVQPDGKQDICSQAMLVGLRCLSGSTNWEGLQQLDRPMLLYLKKDGLPQPGLAKKMRGDQLQIDDGIWVRWVEKNNLEKQWGGDFVMLWRPPKGVALVGRGSSGVAVTWLRERLSLADGEPVPSTAGVDHFDDHLQQRLQQFQQTHGLTADGIAGAWSMILLNNLHRPADTPVLMDGG